MKVSAYDVLPISLFTETPHIEGDGIRNADILFWLGLPGELDKVKKMFRMAAMKDGAEPEQGAQDCLDLLLGTDCDSVRLESVQHAIRSCVRRMRLSQWRSGSGFPHRGARAATWQRGCALGTDAPEQKPIGRSYASLPDRSPSNPSVLAGIFEVCSPSLREEIVGTAGECETPTGKRVSVAGGIAYGKIDHRQRRGYQRKFEACTVRE